MKSKWKRELCVYCSTNIATTDDHIIARQFFPNNIEYRDNLPKVPSCGICNTEKQKVEDGPAVLLQFAHPSEGSKLVIQNRVPNTLEKNKRLYNSMKKGLTWKWLQQKSKKIDKLTFIEIDKKNQIDLYKWYNYLVKGFYYWSLRTVLDSSSNISLIKPISQDHVTHLCNYIRSIKNYKEEHFAKKEFHFLFASDEMEHLSLCGFNFKSILMFGITYKNNISSGFKKMIKRWQWKI